MSSADPTPSLVAAVSSRHGELARALSKMPVEALRADSLLPLWNRLTVVCHLRYGAEASYAMTLDVLAGRTASYYPQGRSKQRPSTLETRPGETPGDVVTSLAETSSKLDDLWQTLDPDQWQLEIREPSDNIDLGLLTLAQLLVLRLTEVEVHGHDLDIGLRPWSTAFVDAAFGMRVKWLEHRRSNHKPADSNLEGTWVLRPDDGPVIAIKSAPNGVSVSEGESMASTVSGADSNSSGHAVIAGTKGDLLAFLLGRVQLHDLKLSGDRQLAAAFHQAFPSP